MTKIKEEKRLDSSHFSFFTKKLRARKEAFPRPFSHGSQPQARETAGDLAWNTRFLTVAALHRACTCFSEGASRLRRFVGKWKKSSVISLSADFHRPAAFHCSTIPKSCQSDRKGFCAKHFFRFSMLTGPKGCAIITPTSEYVISDETSSTLRRSKGKQVRDLCSAAAVRKERDAEHVTGKPGRHAPCKDVQAGRPACFGFGFMRCEPRRDRI